MQKFSATGTLQIPELNVQDDFAVKVIRLILDKKTLLARKFIIENEVSFKSDYGLLMKALFDTLCQGNYGLSDQHKKLWLITIGEYMYRSSSVLDQEINFYCLLLALSEITS